MTKLLKYIEAVPKTNGKVYFYFRRKGQRTPIPGDYNSPEFLQAYWSLRKSPSDIEIAADRTLPGSVNAAVVAFYKHHSFAKNSRSPSKLIAISLKPFAPSMATNALPCCNSITSRR